MQTVTGQSQAAWRVGEQKAVKWAGGKASADDSSDWQQV